MNGTIVPMSISVPATGSLPLNLTAAPLNLLIPPVGRDALVGEIAADPTIGKFVSVDVPTTPDAQFCHERAVKTVQFRNLIREFSSRREPVAACHSGVFPLSQEFSRVLEEFEKLSPFASPKDELPLNAQRRFLPELRQGFTRGVGGVLVFLNGEDLPPELFEGPLGGSFKLTPNPADELNAMAGSKPIDATAILNNFYEKAWAIIGDLSFLEVPANDPIREDITQFVSAIRRSFDILIDLFISNRTM